jgi:hypothetical protein
MTDDDFMGLDDFVVDVDISDDPDATRVADPTAPSATLYVFEPEGDDVTEVLKRSGLKVQRGSMGSEMMAAAMKRQLSAILVGPNTDAELRELFMRAFRGKFPKIPVIYMSGKFNDPSEQAQYRYEGATSVLPWPPPPPADLLAAVQAFVKTPIELVGTALPEPGSPEATEELDVLKRKVEALEQRRQAGDLDPKQYARAVSEAEQHLKEATSLRSELTLVRERSSMLQERIDRLIQDLATMTKERDEHKLKLQKAARKLKETRELTNPGTESGDTIKSLKKIGQSADSFVWGLEQAIQFFEDLSFEAGDKRAPSLKGHIRSLKLVRALLEKLRDRLHQL